MFRLRHVWVLVVFAALAADVRGEEPALIIPTPIPAGSWINQSVCAPNVTSMDQLDIRTHAFDMDPNDLLRAAVEIRTADNSKRIAVIAMPWHADPANGFVMVPEMYGFFSIDKPALRRMGPVPPGHYVMAWLLRGERRSNVLPFTIEANHDLAKDPAIRVLQLEPRHPGELPTVQVVVTRAKQSDPAPNDYEIADGEILVDGARGTGHGIAFNGPVAPLEVGHAESALLAWSTFKPPIDTGKPHQVTVEIAKQKSLPVALETGTPLGAAWDKATANLAPAHETPTLISGLITGTDGKPAVGYAISLDETRTHENYDEHTDALGRYGFQSLPKGVYNLSLYANAIGQGEPRITMQKVAIDPAKPVTLNLSFNPTFTISGRVTTADRPAAGVMVSGLWYSPDESITYQNHATTDADGNYTISSPFAKVGMICAGERERQQVVQDVTAPRKNLNFNLPKPK